MFTKIVRPIDRGYDIDLVGHPSSGFRWQKLLSNDGDTTYVYANTTPGVPALLSSSYATSWGVQVAVYSVTVVAVVRKDNVTVVTGNAIPYARLSPQPGDAFFGTSQSVTTTYASYSHVWLTNPNTGNRWTWEEMLKLEIGIRVETDDEVFGATPGAVKVTELYGILTYTPVVRKLIVQKGSKVTLKTGTKVKMSYLT